jgi:hypothetical protein
MGKNQDPGSGINIPDPQHWLKASFFDSIVIGIVLMPIRARIAKSHPKFTSVGKSEISFGIYSQNCQSALNYLSPAS